VTGDQGTVHKLRPRSFHSFVITYIPPGLAAKPWDQRATYFISLSSVFFILTPSIVSLSRTQSVYLQYIYSNSRYIPSLPMLLSLSYLTTLKCTFLLIHRIFIVYSYPSHATPHVPAKYRDKRTEKKNNKTTKEI